MPFQIAHDFFRLVWDEKSLFYPAMASTGLESVLCLLLLGLALCSFQHGCSFAKPRQESAASYRERSGGALRGKVTEFIELNPDESRLLSSGGEKAMESGSLCFCIIHRGCGSYLHGCITCRCALSRVQGRCKDVWTGPAEMQIHERAYVRASPENLWQAQRLC